MRPSHRSACPPPAASPVAGPPHRNRSPAHGCSRRAACEAHASLRRRSKCCKVPVLPLLRPSSYRRKPCHRTSSAPSSCCSPAADPILVSPWKTGLPSSAVSLPLRCQSSPPQALPWPVQPHSRQPHLQVSPPDLQSHQPHPHQPHPLQPSHSLESPLEACPHPAPMQQAPPPPAASRSNNEAARRSSSRSPPTHSCQPVSRGSKVRRVIAGEVSHAEPK